MESAISKAKPRGTETECATSALFSVEHVNLLGQNINIIMKNKIASIIYTPTKCLGMQITDEVGGRCSTCGVNKCMQSLGKEI
jgi:hypothetical protein